MEADGHSRVLDVDRSIADQPTPLEDLARRCYPDMAVSVVDAEEAWRIRLSPLVRLAAARDSELGSVLAGMNCELDEMTAWRRTDRIARVFWLEALNSAWALFAWSQWLSEGGVGRPLILLLGGGGSLETPELICDREPDRFHALMEDFAFRIDDPHAVASAIERGVISGTSFVTPFLRARTADVIQRPSDVSAGQTGPVQFTVEAAAWPREPSILRLEVQAGGGGGCSYQRIADPGQAAATHRAGRPTLVHIDLGYFDRVQSRRGAATSGAGLSPAELVERLAPLAGSIAAISVAYAPGVCPSRRWAALSGGLRACFDRLLAPRGPSA